MPRRHARTTWLAALTAPLAAVSLLLPTTSAHAITATPAAAGAYAFTAKLDIGTGDDTRACSATLIEARWLLTAASCFAADPAVSIDVPAGAPALPTTATVGRTDLATTGGQVREIVELVPHPDRDLVLARLATAVTGITPVTLSATAPVAGEQLKVAGYGRTTDEWSPLKLHTGTFGVDAVGATEIDITGQGGAAVCAGDTGGPAFRESGGTVQLVAINSRSWQGGCFGTDESVTSTGAIDTRVDDLAGWIGPQVARWALKAHVNDKYVTTELNATGNHTGKLRARSDTAAGSWEQFTLHTRDGGTTIALRSLANGLYVTTENSQTGDYNGMLRARTAIPYGWESYTLVPQGGANYALRAEVNDKYVAVEANYTGDDANLLRARSAAVTGGWERFTFEHADNFQVAGAAPAAPTPLPLG
ncbi:trypsin-like serine protease [Streptomyces sp. NPDC059477]|uniref:trypsin-like serine protease n=1 Tax=Streptomyces sp. NPDC059477 TaxID=3346847 RepID=UPI003673FC14